MKYFFRFFLELDDQKITEELFQYGECVVLIRSDGKSITAVSERNGDKLGEGLIELLGSGT
ncbi:hypothetical protein [Thermococcus sp.]